MQYSFAIPKGKSGSQLTTAEVFYEIHSSASIEIRYRNCGKDGDIDIDLTSYDNGSKGV